MHGCANLQRCAVPILAAAVLSFMENKMKYRIRRARFEDAEYLEKYMQRLIGEELPVLYSKAAPPSLDEVTVFIKTHSNPNALLLLVVVDDDRIIGMLDADIHKNAQRSHCASFGMSILNEYRRRGIGRALLAELFLWSKQHHLKRIELEVFSNNLSAIELYKKMGFLVEGVKKEAVRVGSGFVDIVHMAHACA